MANEEQKKENVKTAADSSADGKAVQSRPAPGKSDKKDEKPAGRSADKRGDRRGGGRGGQRKGRRGDRRQEEKEFEQRILSLDRVTRVTKGGKRMRFRAAMIIGDEKKHRVGYGVSKAGDVANAVNKAVRQAKKAVISVPLVEETIPHEISQKYGAARILLKPAPKGTGVKAGGAVRVVLMLAGIPNVTGKILGSKSKLNNAKATMAALKRLSTAKTE